MSSSGARRARRSGGHGQGGGDEAASSASKLHAWVHAQLADVTKGLGPGWKAKKVAPRSVAVGCAGCGNLGKQRQLVMLTRLQAHDICVLFTIVELCEDCAGDKAKTDALGEGVFGPEPDSPAAS